MTSDNASDNAIYDGLLKALGGPANPKPRPPEDTLTLAEMEELVEALQAEARSSQGPPTEPEGKPQ